jgi:hypothetical protein
MFGNTRARVAVAAAACVFTMACGGKGGSTGAGVASTCETPGGKLTLGVYEVQNNTYVNTEAVPPAHPETDFRQCASLGPGGTAQTVDATWTWRWPHQSNPDEQIVRATPSIIYGFNPWNAGSTTPDLPRRVGEVQRLRVDAASVEQSMSDGSVSRVAVIVYLTDSNQKPAGQNALTIRGTISVFVNDYPPRAAGGTTVRFGGVDYDVFVYGSTVYYYRRPDLDTPVTALHLDVAEFLADSVARGAHQRTWWVASVSTGPIVEEGIGTLALEDYKVTFQAGSLPVLEELTISKEGTGSGTVTSTPAGIDCGSACSASFPAGSGVTLTASAAEGSTFAGWSGACTGTGTCTVTVDGATAVTATFDRTASDTETCATPGGTLTRGEYLVENGTYGNAQSPSPISNYTQCATLTAGTAQGTVNAAWAWSWPQTDNTTIRATPAIVYGFKPWSPASTTANLPALLGDVGALTLDAGVGQQVGTGQISKVVVTVWLTSSNVKAEGETVLPIVGSLNIFLNSYGSTGSGPTPVTIDDVDYDLFRNGTSTTLNYWRRNGQGTPITELHLDVAKFLADGQSRGVFDPSWWVASVETATWLTQGTGSLGLTDYEVGFQPAVR